MEQVVVLIASIIVSVFFVVTVCFLCFENMRVRLLTCLSHNRFSELQKQALTAESLRNVNRLQKIRIGELSNEISGLKEKIKDDKKAANAIANILRGHFSEINRREK